MNINSWDPLKSSENADTEIISAAQKREIRNILKSYVGMFDSFSELIQNALDAVDKRFSKDKVTGYQRKLWLTVNLKDNIFSITDNGIGFNKEEFKSFLAPNISFKDGDESRGNKGVGATYIAYGFDFLQFGTKGNGHNFMGEITQGREWVEDRQGIITRPMVRESNLIDQNFNLIDRGSTFSLKFGGDFTRPKNLNWFTATTPMQWLFLLLIKTPLGCIYDDNTDYTPVHFDLTVIDSANEIKSISNADASYIFPHTKINASVNLREIIKIQQKLIQESKDPSKIPNKYFKSNGIYQFFSPGDLLNFKNLSQEYKDIVTEYKIQAYGYFTYSTAVWDQFNDSLANLRKGMRILKGGLQLANNRMIQGELLSIPLTSNIGYQNQCHVIVHFKDADPDLGRKGFQPELKDAAERLSVIIVNTLKEWKSLLKSDTGTKPNIEKEVELYDWIKSQEKHEEQSPLIISNKNFFIPVNEISITSTPQSEQDVIVLFNQLIAGGVIRGLNLLATSQIKQYDGVYRFVVKQPLENHKYDKIFNPLGVDDFRHENEVKSAPKILEYKYNLDALIREFENGEKKEKDIHLVIVWEMGSEWRKNYDTISLLDLDNIHQREFHGITHSLTSGNTNFDVICLKELVEYLNGVDDVQIYHKNEYSESLF
jgi:hypothetical protein